MKTVTIGSLTQPIQKWNPCAFPGQEFNYIDIASIDTNSKHIGSIDKISTDTAPARARQKVEAGDVLVSTVRPNLNAVAWVPQHMEGATASTGFSVLRSSPLLDSRFLFHWVRTPIFISSMIKKATGQSYPAVSDRVVKQSSIPFPPKRLQRQIAAILDQIDILREQRRKSISLLDKLEQATFFEMFGDPVANSRDWPQGSVSDLVDKFESGKNINASENPVQKRRVLKVSAVTSGIFRPAESKPVPDSYEPPANHFVNSGDLLFSRANTEDLIGAIAYARSIEQELLLPDKIWRFRWKNPTERNHFYVRQLFRQNEARRFVRERSSGTSGSMKNISQKNVLSIPMGIPPLELREKFTDFAEAISTQQDRFSASLTELDALFASAQARAFRGELWETVSG